MLSVTVAATAFRSAGAPGPVPACTLNWASALAQPEVVLVGVARSRQDLLDDR
jgi:hypothetical protein